MIASASSSNPITQRSSNRADVQLTISWMVGIQSEKSNASTATATIIPRSEKRKRWLGESGVEWIGSDIVTITMIVGLSNLSPNRDRIRGETQR